MKGVLVFGLLVAVGAAVWAGLGSAADRHSRGARAATSVTISNEQGTTWTCGFNPFNGSVQFLSAGTVYEELTFVNGLKSGQTTNWLASGYSWSNHNKTLTFTIRPGVKWSDGKPFSAADVLFTFQLLKKFPALDLNAAWSVSEERDAQNGSNKVVFNFKTVGCAVLLLHRRPDADRRETHLVNGEEPRHLQGSRTRSAQARSR